MVSILEMTPGGKAGSPAVADSGLNHSERSFCLLLEFRAIRRFFSPAAGFSCTASSEAGSFESGYFSGNLSQLFADNRSARSD